jgi:glutaminase
VQSLFGNKEKRAQTPILAEPPLRSVKLSPATPGGPIQDFLRDLHEDIRNLKGGAVATYIPELAKAKPDHCGIAIATVDGAIYAVGDCDEPFTIQSVSKPFVYGYALQEYGRAEVLKHVGVEPTGEAFNSIVLDEENNRPFNPMVNAGAIAAAELIRGATPDARRAASDSLFARFAGRPLAVDETVYRSEKDTGHRNRAIAYMMLNSGMLKREPEDILDIYFRQCSLLVSARDLAIMGAALANDGVNPLTGERALNAEYVHDVLTVMNSCGMYNYAGQWSYEIGMPAKSGVSGSILAVIPGQAGIAIYSPPIDKNGNSVRGVEACKRIAEEFGLHVFRTHPNARSVIRREFRGDMIRSKRRRTARERAILDDKGRSICVIEAQDALFFGSAERLLRRAAELAREADYLVIDLRRVYGADDAARKLLARFLDEAKRQKQNVILAHLHANGALAELHKEVSQTADANTIFANRDDALEWCENRLLAATAQHHATALQLKDIDLFKGLGPADLKQIETLARPMAFDAGATIVREGDAANLLFTMAQGVASVRLNLQGDQNARNVRLTSIGPGQSFGEMALLDGGRRSADVVADQKVLCYGFSVEELRELGVAHPMILNTILSNIARDLTERLRLANNEIRTLES